MDGNRVMCDSYWFGVTSSFTFVSIFCLISSAFSIFSALRASRASPFNFAFVFDPNRLNSNALRLTVNKWYRQLLHMLCVVVFVSLVLLFTHMNSVSVFSFGFWLCLTVFYLWCDLDIHRKLVIIMICSPILY